VALNLSALIELERAVESMMDFSFTSVEYRTNYGAALKAFCARKRRLRNAYAAWATDGLRGRPGERPAP